MVEWLAGNRIIGTNAERTTVTATGIPKTSGGWKELARAKGSVPDITNLPNKKYYMVLGHHVQGSGNSGVGLQFNGDVTANHYPRRYQALDAADAIPLTETNVFFDTNGSTVSGKEWFTVMYIANEPTKEKLGIFDINYNRDGLGSQNSVNFQKGIFKWTNVADSINRIKFSDFNGTALNADSEVVVLGWDSDDTHADNFWEELGSVSGDGTQYIDVGTFTAKKYLWVQMYLKPVSSSNSMNLSFNGYGGSPYDGYAQRLSYDGSNYGAGSRDQAFYSDGFGTQGARFLNFFIINASGYEKLITSTGIYTDNTSNSAGVAPRRMNHCGKWENTSEQITSMKVNGSGGGFTTDSFIKVWGHD